MDHIHLSKRLQTISRFIEPGERVADIGTDHALLPIELVKRGAIQFAVASDIGAGPVAIAKQNVAAAGLTKQIDVRQADGLAGIKPVDAISTIVIAGMGGQLITNILDAGMTRMDGTETLVLAPNRHQYDVRLWLDKHGYGIIGEQIVEDEGHIYEIMAAGKAKPDVPYSEADLRFGPILRRQKNPVFMKKMHREAEKTEAVLEGLADARMVPLAKIREQEHILALIKEELNAHDKR
ncbi:tRNA (adenine(22)-N(1))-methyltransferase [Lacticaseibacillus chiayiensis]|uniref:tRNA (adenine(22)-N(1))-methyltransferase n=1 Tax=Lacticaseibacillus chiayiensis TaxID=2100821 RepID=UPI0010131A57|nr:tRNA (adenine(22)-N(1))-methyltransferase TrmK [Lacticaseibacillus chiayiensis]RXT58414.1 SAM-dependent methyltransferase [Lacticaseibacillus chiayiensis]